MLLCFFMLPVDLHNKTCFTKSRVDKGSVLTAWRVESCNMSKMMLKLLLFFLFAASVNRWVPTTVALPLSLIFSLLS